MSKPLIAFLELFGFGMILFAVTKDNIDFFNVLFGAALIVVGIMGSRKKAKKGQY